MHFERLRHSGFLSEVPFHFCTFKKYGALSTLVNDKALSRGLLPTCATLETRRARSCMENLSGGRMREGVKSPSQMTRLDYGA